MYNINMRMREYIKALLVKENFSVFTSLVDDQGCDLVVRNILADNSPQYIEIQILSRTEEYQNELVIPVSEDKLKGHFCYFILYSAGMNKFWLLRSDELIKCRTEGLDERDTSPYVVNNFSRLKFPELSLEEYKKSV